MKIPVICIVASLAFLGIAAPSAHSSERILGLTEFDLVSCAGAPSQVMEFGGQGRIYVYVAGNVTTTVNKVFNTYIGSANSNTCQATVIIQGGRVTGVKYQKSGGLIAREIQCGKLFSSCRVAKKKK